MENGHPGLWVGLCDIPVAAGEMFQAATCRWSLAYLAGLPDQNPCPHQVSCRGRLATRLRIGQRDQPKGNEQRSRQRGPATRLSEFGYHTDPFFHLVPVFYGSSHARRPSRADRKSTRLNSSHANISYAVFCLKKKNT